MKTENVKGSFELGLKRIVLYLTLFIVCFAAIFIPYYVQFAEPYFAPSIINGIYILEYGHIPDYSSLNKTNGRLLSDLEIEESYPLPGVLAASILVITGLPYIKAAYIPLAGLCSLLYFILARYILSNRDNKLVISLSIIYFILNCSLRLPALTNGRGGLGIALLILFVFSFIRFIESPGSKIASWLIVSLITTAVIGGTYYTATLAIITAITTSFITPQNKVGLFSSKERGTISFPRGFSILVIAILLFISPPILSTITSNLNLHSFWSHVIDALYSKAGLEYNESNKLWGIYLENNLISKIRLLCLRLIILLSFVSVMHVLIKGVLNTSHRATRQWLYAIIVAGTCISEIPYMIKSATISTRLLIVFGLLCLMSVIKEYKKAFCAYALMALVVIFIAANTYFALKMGGILAAKPYAAKNVEPVAKYICNNVSNETIAADACYASNIWLYLSNEKDTCKANLLPLGLDALTLGEAINGSVTPLLDVLRKRAISFLLVNTDNMPFYGDAWGYSVSVKRTELTDSMSLNSIYDDNKFILYRKTNLN